MIQSARIGFDGQWILSSTEYNAFGYLEHESRPGLTAPSASKSTFFYDRLGRTLIAITPDQQATNFTHSI
jgi:hypothetical protein